MAAPVPEILLKIDPHLFLEMLYHPATKVLREFLKECKELQKTQLSEGLTLSLDSLDKTGLQTALMMGEIKGQDLILQIWDEVEEYIASVEEDKDGVP